MPTGAPISVYPTAGTPFDRTRTRLRDWFYVMFLFTTTRNGVAAKRVQREIGVTYKTAWRMCHQIREYMAALDSDDPLGGEGETVEIDETLIGGAATGMGRGYYGQQDVRHRDAGEAAASWSRRVVPNAASSVTCCRIIQAYVLPGTDDPHRRVRQLQRASRRSAIEHDDRQPQRPANMSARTARP